MGKSPCLHEDLSVNPQHLWERKPRNLGIAACACHTRIRIGDKQILEAYWLTGPDKIRSFQFNERPSPEGIR